MFFCLALIFAKNYYTLKMFCFALCQRREMPMCDESRIREFLERECYTTPEERDPRKPLILEGEMVRPNPDYDIDLVRREADEKEVERRRKRLGTSFFLNFDPLCRLHQQPDVKGEFARNDIVRQLSERFLEVFVAQFPKEPPFPINGFRRVLSVQICPYAQPGFNNGEVYLWLPGIPLEENFVFQMLKAFRDSLEKELVVANIDGTDYPVQFYGWGFRYY